MIERLMRQHLRDFRADTILEVGPGYSPFGRVAANITGANNITFVDCDPSVLAWQVSECSKINLAAEYLLVSLESDDLSALGGPYDLILCMEILEHLPNAEEVLRALANRLSPEGRMVITVPTKLSERLMKWLNPSYMEGQVHGHVREFDEHGLREILNQAGLYPLVFIPTQPQAFLSHMWLYGTRMKVEIATGSVLTKGLRRFIGGRLDSYSMRFFMLTGPEWWGRILPRNYFVVGKRGLPPLT